MPDRPLGEIVRELAAATAMAERVTRQYLERKTKSNLAQMVLDLMDDRWRDFLAGVEFGVRAHEKGMNLQAALEDAKKMSQKEQP